MRQKPLIRKNKDRVTPTKCSDAILGGLRGLINNALLYHFLALAHNKKMTEKYVFAMLVAPPPLARSRIPPATQATKLEVLK